MASLIQIFTFNFHKKPKNDKTEKPKTALHDPKVEENTPQPCICLAFPPHFALSQTLDF